MLIFHGLARICGFGGEFRTRVTASKPLAEELGLLFVGLNNLLVQVLVLEDCCLRMLLLMISAFF